MTDKEYGSDVNIRPEVVGFPAILQPFLAHVSTPRMAMFSSNTPQDCFVSGAEPPRAASGYEPKLAKYTFDRRDHDMVIESVVPKFMPGNGISNNPKLTVIGRRADDVIDYFDVDSYTELSKGAGFINRQEHKSELVSGNYIPKELKFNYSPADDGELYNLGVNANVIYAPFFETTDDAFVISDELADKLEHDVVSSTTLSINKDDIPLNIYGDYDLYKSFPDIGEFVRDDGKLLAIRKVSPDTILADTNIQALSKVQIHDDVYLAPPGAEIIDVEIYTNPKSTVDVPCEQHYKYQMALHSYYERILDVYDKVVREGRELSPAFRTLVTRAMAFGVGSVRMGRKGKNVICTNKKEPIEHIYIKLTYHHRRKVARAFKLTGRSGDKGVISAIWKKEDMPMTASGIRADILITGESPINRMNLSQLYAQFLNYACDIVAMRSKSMDPKEAYKYIMKLLYMIRPNYAKETEKFLSNATLRDEFVVSCQEDGIHYTLPPASKSLRPEMILEIAKEFNLEQEEITYHRYDRNGNRIKVTCSQPSIISSKYLNLLSKFPLDSLVGVGPSHISQFGSPIKPKSPKVRAQKAFGNTPVRLGEDETANLIMTNDAEMVARMYGTYGNSIAASEELMYTALTAKHPSVIDKIDMSTEEIISSSSNISLLHHQLAVAGIGIEDINETEGK